MKTCSKCKLEKDLSEFKRYSICIECNKILTKIYNDSRKEKMKEYYQEKKELLKDRNKVYYKNNKEYIKNRNSEYALKNKNKRNSYLSNRKKNDNLFHLTTKIRNLIYISFYNGGFSKKSKTNDILGCSFEEFKTYIESQFQEGMSWENQGEWHLDHKTPISWAKTEKQVYELNHYTNFQPLWAENNLSKGNKWSD
jgi:hypothetical protein